MKLKKKLKFYVGLIIFKHINNQFEIWQKNYALIKLQIIQKKYFVQEKIIKAVHFDFKNLDLKELDWIIEKGSALVMHLEIISKDPSKYYLISFND